MRTIASRQNPWFKRLRDAVREHAGEIAIEGPKAVADAIAAGWTPIAVAVRGADAAAAPSAGATLALAPGLFDTIAATRAPQNVIGLFERPAPRDVFGDRSRLLVALDGVQDPGNVGTIVRLCAAFDSGGLIVLPGCADPFGPKAIRASAGAVLNVPVAESTAAKLLASGWPLVVADTHGERVAPPSAGAVIVFGNEGSGVSAVLATAAAKIAVPMSSRVESLNVASSAAILLAQAYAKRA